MEDITTSDHTLSSDSSELDSGPNSEPTLSHSPPSEQDLRVILEHLFLEGFQGPKVLEILEN